jgi:hypothetical protein
MPLEDQSQADGFVPATSLSHESYMRRTQNVSTQPRASRGHMISSDSPVDLCGTLELSGVALEYGQAAAACSNPWFTLGHARVRAVDVRARSGASRSSQETKGPPPSPTPMQPKARFHAADRLLAHVNTMDASRPNPAATAIASNVVVIV